MPLHAPICLSHRGEQGARAAQRLQAGLRELFGEPVVDLVKLAEDEVPSQLGPGSVLLVLLTPDYADLPADPDADGAGAPSEPVRRHLLAALATRAHLQVLRIDQTAPLLAHGLSPDLVTLATQPSLPLRHSHWGADLAALCAELATLGFLTDEHGAPALAGAAPARRGWRTLTTVGVLALLLAGATQVGLEALDEREAQVQMTLAQQAQFSITPDLVAARQAYERALAARPDIGVAHFQLAHLLLRQREFTRAREHLSAALRDHDGLPTARRQEALRLMAMLSVDDEPTPVERPIDHLAVAASAPAVTDGGLEIPSEPTAAGTRPGARPVRGKPGKRDIEAIAAQAERAALAAMRPQPSSDLLFGADAPELALLASRIAPSSELQRELALRLDALYAVDPQVRWSAASELDVSSQLHSDVLPLAVERAEANLLHRAGTAAVTEAARHTLTLLGEASPLTLALHRQAVLRFVDAAAVLGPEARQQGEQVRERITGFTRVPQPVIYIQLADEVQRPLAMRLATQLAEAGWRVPALAVVGDQAPSRTELRSQGTSHQGLARWVRRLASDQVGQTADLVHLRQARPSGDVYELWLDQDLCRAGARQVNGCPG
ncbi:tetratricopeptide repeat protein [Sphaerotilus mobilis]|uniref:Tetratricopeptide repeat protein n=1 Tax=Sphaerotilus mobilis TaxID=47994 RepID=A0A4Q7LEA8_9BURK|nr:tetratricopeptide repeat protein [Sphaerotilus mobilis]RZS52332.1 hypothetical protein EV685_3525 [Sphaerotilus mobilis]